MTGYADCIGAIRKAAGEILSDDDVEKLVSQVQRRYRERRKSGALEDDRKLLAEIASGIANEERLAALIEKRSRAINVLRMQQRDAAIDAFLSNPGVAESKAISILNVGREGRGAGFGNSVAAQQRGLVADLLGPMIAELRAGNLLDLIGRRNPEIEKEIARNMWEISNAQIEKRSPVLSGRKESQETARIFAKYQEAARQMQNDAGAWIGKAAGWIVRQSHDMFRLRRAGYEAWRDTIASRLDDRTFANLDEDTPQAREEFLHTVYNELVSGEHYRDRGFDEKLGAFKGPGSLAKRASQHRVLQFKSADEWLAYNDAFGHDGVVGAVFHGLERSARNTALMRTWGTNPEAAFDATMDRLRERAAKRGDVKEVDRLKGWQVQAEFDDLTGLTRIPGDPTLARRGAIARALINLTSLGGVVISSLPDNAIKAAVLHHHGIGFFDGHLDAMRDVFRGRGSGWTREAADHLGVGFDGLTGDLAAKWSAEDTIPGKVARIQNAFFRLNLLSWWTDAKATGTGLMMAHNLARNAGKEFGALDPLLQTTLRRYGIGPDQWAALRRVEMKGYGDTRYLMPDAVDRLSDDIVKPLAGGDSPAAIARARTDLRLALRTFYAEEVASAQTFAGPRERAIVTWGTRPGTPLGEAVRFMMQYKLFSITFATRHIARELARGGVPGMVHLILANTALGYLAMQAKEIAKGREPRKADDTLGFAKIAMAAAQQGGGLGIYGDFLFGQYNRFGGGGLETLAGPAAGKVGDVLRTFGNIKEGQGHAAGNLLLRTAVNAVPGINLFYTRAALDYLILYQMQEWASPGYLRRMERNIQQQNRQRFIIPPSSVIPYGGGNRLFEGIR